MVNTTMLSRRPAKTATADGTRESRWCLMMPDVKCRSCWSDTLSTSFKALHMWSSAVSGSPGLYLQLSCAVCRFPCLRPSFSVWTHELYERWSIDVNCLRVRGSNLQGFYAVKHPWQKVRIGRYLCKIMQVYNTTTYITTAFSPYFYKDPMSTSLYTDLQPCVLVSQSRFVCWYYFCFAIDGFRIPFNVTSCMEHTWQAFFSGRKALFPWKWTQACNM